MIRQTVIRQYDQQSFDLDKIRQVAGADVNPDDVYDIGKFIIARSGRNNNRTDITSEAQKSAVTAWIGKPVYYNGHKYDTDNQVGRIYEAWTEDKDGETLTYGRAYGAKTKDDKDEARRTKIQNRINREMSCGYECSKSVCSICGNDVTKSKGICISHANQPDYYAKDIEIVPNHVAFVGDPAVDGCGLCTHSRKDADDTALRMLADDGKTFRTWTCAEFAKWYRLNNRNATIEEIETLTGKLSAKEMVTFARLEQSRFQEVIPTGAQQLTAPSETTEQTTNAPKYKSIKDIFKQEDK